MAHLVECLARFNRKERYWLIRNVLGDPSDPIPLATSFLELLKKEADLDIPADAWWAIDYHIDWLFGALQSYLGPALSGPYRADLLTGSQEDFDFVIAYDKTLILIEAKATGRWRKSQYDSKFSRLDRLQKTLFKDCDLTVKTLLMSPGSPPDGLQACWIRLSMDEEREHFTVLKRSPGAKNPEEWALVDVKNPGYSRPGGGPRVFDGSDE